MKILILNKYVGFFILILLLLISCNKDFLDPSNPSGLSSSDIWSDPNLIQLNLNGLYNDLSGWDQNVYNNISDEARKNTPGPPTDVLWGSWNAVSNPMDIWAKTYGGIRKNNEFLYRIANAPVVEKNKITMKGECRFIRSLLYFDLVKRYGGVPIIKTPQSLDDGLLVERSTIEDCFNFIVQELDSAINELPVNAVKGRASKGAAMALKGRVLMFYASPLYNEANDPLRWEKAADACKAVIDMNKYKLYSNLKTLWLDESNQESIFEIQYKLPEKQHGWDSWVKPLIIANNAAGQCSPLQELVNAFPMKNGTAISDPSSGFDPNNPYLNRDNRFYDFIGYNGAKTYGTTSGPPIKEITLQIYDGGRDYNQNPGNAVYNTLTGYNCLKALDPTNTVYRGNSGSSQPWIEIRYAEILLDYAECQNEFLANPDATIYDALNQIRRRAGITTDIPATLSKEEMRKLIRNERYIELCFEHKRYWDIRRWKLATTMLNGSGYTGVFITKQSDGSFTYKYVNVDSQPLVFNDYMYFMPIPFTEITKNKNLKQNPGWD